MLSPMMKARGVMQMPPNRLIVPLAQSSQGSGVDSASKDNWAGILVKTDGMIQTIGADHLNSYIKTYTDWGYAMTRGLRPGRWPADMEVKCTDTSSTINDGTSANFWQDGYNYAGPYSTIDTGLSDTLGVWLDCSPTGSDREFIQFENSGQTAFGPVARMKVELRSVALGWSALYDWRLTCSSSGGGSESTPGDIIGLPK